MDESVYFRGGCNYIITSYKKTIMRADDSSVFMGQKWLEYNRERESLQEIHPVELNLFYRIVNVI